MRLTNKPSILERAKKTEGSESATVIYFNLNLQPGKEHFYEHAMAKRFGINLQAVALFGIEIHMSFPHAIRI
jgi:hypothetical protein